MSAYWKIPLQALVLLIGVLVFTFYLFNAPPLLFNPRHERAVRDAQPAAYAQLESRYTAERTARDLAARDLARAVDTPDKQVAARRFRQREAQVQSVRTEALDLASQVTGQPSRDVNYIIPRFVLDHLPIGLAGIFIAAILAAAMNAVAAELNSLATASVVDFYKRWVRNEASDAHFLNVSRAATGIWGVFACIIATFAANLGSLIEVVNRFGSFFYGSILGVFMLAMIPRTRGTGAFVGLLAGMSAVAAVNFGAPKVSFLWHNVVGAVTVVAVGTLLSMGGGARTDRPVVQT